jgi:hypothetical protein
MGWLLSLQLSSPESGIAILPLAEDMAERIGSSKGKLKLE